MPINLEVLPEKYAVLKLDPAQPLPRQMYKSALYCITKSDSELSILCEQKYAPKGATTNPGWKLLKYEGSLETGGVGIVASITKPLATAGISVIVYTTYDNGYFGVNEGSLKETIGILMTHGLSIL